MGSEKMMDDPQHPYRTMDDREWTHRIKEGHYERAVLHLWANGSPPIGYDLTNGRLVPNKEESEIVLQIFHLRETGLSLYKIATELNDEGHITKRGKSWTARAVRDIINNEIYIGNFSVAGVRAYLEELKIVSDELFRGAKMTAELNAKYRHKSGG